VAVRWAGVGCSGLLTIALAMAGHAQPASGPEEPPAPVGSESEMQIPEGGALIPSPSPGPALLPSLGVTSGDERIQRAWRDRGRGLDARVARVRNTALALGIRELDVAARALLIDESLGSRVERSEAAVALAPGLPDAHTARAWSLLLDERDPVGAFRSLRLAAGSVEGHLEGSAWFRATAVDAASRWAIWSSLLFLFVAAAVVFPRSVVLLSQRAGMPPVSAAAGLAAALLLPAALGEGLAGAAMACAALALCWGGTVERLACAAAGVALLVGLHPLATWRDAELAVLSDAPVAEAVHRTEMGLAAPLDRARLSWAAPNDSLAARALALDAKRSGDLRRASRDFQTLLADDEGGDAGPAPELLANAANVQLAVGRVEEATSLYERAAQMQPTPLMLFNLSQVYGRAIRLEEQDLALAEAQTLDAVAVRSLISLVAAHDGAGVIDLAVPPAEVRHRAAGRRDSRASLRARFAPGALGGNLPLAAAMLVAAGSAGAFLGRAVRRRALPGDGVTRRQGSTDPTARMARMQARRLRERRIERIRSVLAVAVPGLSAIQKGHPLLGLLSVATAVGFALLSFGGGVVPDPLAAGATGGVLLGAAAVAAGLVYAGFVLLAFAIEEAR
jgi:tetratricopeptide (TPR) repeat protein